LDPVARALPASSQLDPKRAADDLARSAFPIRS
jgi:hypothetical protein